MENALVSVILPCYNARETLLEAVSSVQEQTTDMWELVVVDDASSDGSEALLRQLAIKDSRIHVHKMSFNQGVAAARNFGISLASGRYLAFLDADDKWHPEKLKRQLQCMEEQDAAICWTAYWRMDEVKKNKERLISVPTSLTFEALLHGNVLGCSTVILDLNQVGEVNMPSAHHEDYLLWLQLFKAGHRGCGLDVPLVWYRRQRRSLSANKFRSAGWTWQIYRNHLHLGFFSSTFIFLNYAIKGLKKSM